MQQYFVFKMSVLILTVLSWLIITKEKWELKYTRNVSDVQILKNALNHKSYNHDMEKCPNKE